MWIVQSNALCCAWFGTRMAGRELCGAAIWRWRLESQHDVHDLSGRILLSRHLSVHVRRPCDSVAAVVSAVKVLPLFVTVTPGVQANPEPCTSNSNSNKALVGVELTARAPSRRCSCGCVKCVQQDLQGQLPHLCAELALTSLVPVNKAQPNVQHLNTIINPAHQCACSAAQLAFTQYSSSACPKHYLLTSTKQQPAAQAHHKTCTAGQLQAALVATCQTSRWGRSSGMPVAAHQKPTRASHDMDPGRPCNTPKQTM